MPRLIEPTPPPADDPPGGLATRLGWFIAIALASVAVVAIAAYALKALLPSP